MGLFGTKDKERFERRRLRREAETGTWSATVERCGFSGHGEFSPSFVVLSSGDRMFRSVTPGKFSEAQKLMAITQPGDRIEIDTGRARDFLDFRNLTLGLGATSSPNEVRRLSETD